MVALPGLTEDNAVKTTVIFKFGKHSEPKALRIHLGDRGQIIGRSSYTHRRTGLHSDAHHIALTKDQQIITCAHYISVIVLV